MDVNDTLAERGNRYGDFAGHAKITQALKSVFVDSPKWRQLTDSMKESLEMVAHKIGRILNGDPTYADSWHDIAGYSKLVEDELTDSTPETTPPATPTPPKPDFTKAADALEAKLNEQRQYEAKKLVAGGGTAGVALALDKAAAILDAAPVPTEGRTVSIGGELLTNLPAVAEAVKQSEAELTTLKEALKKPDPLAVTEVKVDASIPLVTPVKK